MKKRIISFALALLLVLGLAACGQSGTQSGTTADTAAAVSNGGTLPLPAETTISDAESAPTTTAAAEPAEDPNEIVELQVSMTTVMAQTRGGEVWFFEEHNDEPLHYEHVRKAYFGTTGTSAEVNYIDFDNNFYSNGVNLEQGGVYEDTLLFENVAQVAQEMNCYLYLTQDGKAYLHKSKGKISYDDFGYGGTKESHDHEFVADNVKQVFDVIFHMAYWTEDGKLYFLNDEEWKLLAEHVVQFSVMKTAYDAYLLILTEDGALSYMNWKQEVLPLEQGVEELFPDTDLYRKDGKCYIFRGYRDGSGGSLELPQTDVDQIIWNFYNVGVYHGTDGLVHFFKNELNGQSLVEEQNTAFPYTLEGMEGLYQKLLAYFD